MSSVADKAVSIRGISKSYTISHEAERTPYFAQAMMHRFRNPFKRLRSEAFWALKGVSSEIRRGEIVGIIGRNGAGKSTLLKIISRITEPTSGEIDLYGRVGSLLEIGTGFHGELSGRENIYLNGQILGMRRKEISKEFDAIVDFAEIEKFIDTPVKRYSSGMYVRLAFAVAAHLKPEILVVDEVLAVGDANFQKRCLGKLEAVGAGGRTVLFVSHSMPTIQRLCQRVILLEAGTIVFDGPTADATHRYLSSDTNRPAEKIWAQDSLPGDEVAKLLSVRITDGAGRVSEAICTDSAFQIEIEYLCLRPESRPTAAIHLVNAEGVTLFCSCDFSNHEWWQATRRTGRVRSVCHIPPRLLAEGQVFVLVAICSYNPNVVHAVERDAICFQVVEPPDGSAMRGPFVGVWPGLIRPELNWEVSPVS